ncbi:uncharacterized protein [Lepeophtheirus salmonis]|uniref:Putative LOC409606 [Apis mellifera] n=2 Tax=Lepeophtheirus salmonis TaxID=72036 RepID=A0A0K2V7K4_LEPSM|nr:uncharacterized protein LOC121128983 isoform X2 [Lepeophtheirus salmonis]XP_040580547.1 uncharacterized protein LOC121128983 isoform X2 [Lepeophtheirus salmonis]XP_040580548.1 uncharacterized protein LOC121128983 isoform X2 [Lepeophtheirus salmonis]
MMGTVKVERHDDHEINEMAKKIVEQNRAKISQNALQIGGHPGNHPLARPGQPSIQSYMGQRLPVPPLPKAAPPLTTGGSTSNNDTEKKLDEESKKGRFGWCEFEKNYVPYIFRHGDEKFTSVRMVERKFLNKFLSVLPPEVNSCHCIRSYYITDAESKLLNEINLKHTDCYFGKEAFTTKDLVVRLKDAKEFYRFLDLCYKKLVLKKSNASDRCGFFRINGESVVPYTVTGGVKYVPLFYFEGETDHLKLKSDEVTGWDLAYLKFCCKVQGIRNELFASEVCRVVALDEIRGHFPQGTTFEDYWPAKGSIEPVNAQRVAAGNWTQKPPSAPPAGHQQSHHHISQAQPPPPQQQPKINNSVSANGTIMSPNYVAAHAAARQAYESQLAASHHFQQFIRAAAANNPLTSLQRNNMNQILRSSSLSSSSSSSNPHPAPPTSMGQHYITNNSSNSVSMPRSDRTFPGKLTQIKEFSIEPSSQPPYKLQRALIDQKIVPCINVRPQIYQDLMMTLPDFVRYFYPDLTIEEARYMLQNVLNVVLYKGNTGHQEILRNEGKCNLYDPVPLVLVKDIMNYMPQMKYMFASSMAAEPSSKRMKL